MASICPPGSPYQEERSLFAAFPFTTIDWNSTEDTVKFTEDDLVTLGLSLTRSSVIIYDIKAYDLKTKQTSNYGFAVYPLIQSFQQRTYFLSGVHQLPVYRGQVS